MTAEQPTQEAIQQEIRHRLEHYQRAFELLGYKVTSGKNSITVVIRSGVVEFNMSPESVADSLLHDPATLDKHRSGMLASMCSQVVRAENGMVMPDVLFRRNDDDPDNDPAYENTGDDPDFEH